MNHGRKAHVIVVGNEKGGSGKSTTAVHVLVSLMRDGYAVGALDLDSRQQTLTRFLENRATFAARQGAALPLPAHAALAPSAAALRNEAEADEHARFDEALGQLAARCDYIVLDCPGNDTFLSRLGHSYADTLVTPLNDSFVDLDLLARVDPVTYAVVRPSRYSEMVWEQRKHKFVRQRSSIDWIVLRNRLSHLDARNKRRVGQALDSLSARIGFRLGAGVAERVIYRELFPSGLTLMDLGESGIGKELSLSQVAARQEVRNLMACLNLPEPAAAGAA